MRNDVPKPPGQRRRRNKPTAAKQVEAGGRVPRPPEGLTEGGRQWWRQVWSSPVSGGWSAADRPAVRRLARIISALSVDREIHSNARREVRALGEATGLELDALDKVLTRYAGLDAVLLAEARQLEDRLGLSPLARRRLGWAVEDPAADDERGKAGSAPAAPAVDGRFLKALEGGRS